MTARFADVSRWAERVKGAVMVGALAVAAASGYAFAITPIIEGGRDFLGSVNIITAGDGVLPATAYTVPAGRQFTLTDLVLTNANESSARGAEVYIGSGPTCTASNTIAPRLDRVLVAPESTLPITFNTGFGFGAGKVVCFLGDEDVGATMRGYLSNAT